MTPATAHGAPLAAWLAYWRLMSRYHRFEVQGFENLTGAGAALVVGYHGRPIAYDLCMLSVMVHDRLGYLPHGIFHGTFGKVPALRWFIEGLGCVFGDGEMVPEVIRRGEHIITVPGGTREAYRSCLQRYRVNWGQRTGYLRMAIKYGLPLIPTAASGVDDAYIGLNDGYRLSKRLGVPLGIPLWLGLGPLGPCPVSLPFPVKISQIVGEPITDTAEGKIDPGDNEALAALHAEVTAKVQGLVDRARRKD